MSRSLIPLLLVVVISLQGQAQTTSAAPPGVAVIRAGVLVDPESGTAARNQTIVVENGKVTAAGASVAVPAGAAVIDLSRFTVLPGLFDAHTHLCMDVDLARDAGNYFYKQEIARLRSAHRIGVPIAFGSDAITELPGLTRGATTMQWVDSYVAAGLAPKDILRAMTATAARTLGVEKERGAIRAQMAADIIATTGNPLEDISALKRVSFVMKDGRVVKKP